MTMTRTATWAGLGTDVSTCKDVSEILKTAGLDYEVSKSEILLPSGKVIPDRVATVKDNGDYIGVVSKSYQIYQNNEAFEFVSDIPNVSIVRAGETKSGMVYLIGKLPETTVLQDTFQPYVIFQTSHNGKYNVRATICPLRIVCQNQFAFSFKQMRNTIDIRHSRQLPTKVAQAHELIVDTAQYMTGFTNTAEELAMLKLHSANSVYEIIDAFFDSTKEITERQQKSIQEKKEHFIRCYEADDNSNFTGTVWGAVNGFADFLTHPEKRKKTKTAAESQFMTVTFDPTAMARFLEIAKSHAF